MRYLQRVGLVSTLLIGGVLGGLMAPLLSEASGISLTLQVDGQPATNPPSILSTTDTSSTCTAAEVTLGFTACYAINTGATTYYTGNGGRQYKITNGSVTGRLRVADKVGVDKFALIGVKFVPVVTNWAVTTNGVTSTVENTDEMHTLTITMHNKFDDAVVNVNNASGVGGNGDYIWTVRTAGEFKAGPTTPTPCYTPGSSQTAKVACTAVRDKVEFTGKGTFDYTKGEQDILSPADNNKCFADKDPRCPTTPPDPNPDTKLNNSLPLSFTVAGPPADQILSFDGLTNPTMGQIKVYPQFHCVAAANDLSSCKPDITLTMKATLYGPDTLVVVNGAPEAYCANCVLSTQDQNDLKNQVANLTKLDKILKGLQKIAIFFHRSTPRLDAFIVKTDAFLLGATAPAEPNCPGSVNVEAPIMVAAATDQIDFATDLAVPGIPAPPETGTIVTRVKPWLHTPSFAADLAGVTLPFTVSGLGLTNFSIITDTLPSPGEGSKTVSVRVDTGPWIITHDPINDPFPNSPNTVPPTPWEVEHISCESTSPATTFSIGTTGQEGEGNDEGGPVTVTALGAGDTLTCTWFIEEDDERYVAPTPPPPPIP